MSRVNGPAPPRSTAARDSFLWELLGHVSGMSGGAAAFAAQPPSAVPIVLGGAVALGQRQHPQTM
jgi:hypothetical protein